MDIKVREAFKNKRMPLRSHKRKNAWFMTLVKLWVSWLTLLMTLDDSWWLLNEIVWRTDEQTDNAKSRVAFATENDTIGLCKGKLFSYRITVWIPPHWELYLVLQWPKHLQLQPKIFASLKNIWCKYLLIGTLDGRIAATYSSPTYLSPSWSSSLTSVNWQESGFLITFSQSKAELQIWRTELKIIT